MDDETSAPDHRSWDELAPEFRRRWQELHPGEAGRWEEYEPWYRFGYAKALDPTYQGKRWQDIEPDLRTLYPTWAERHGYRYDDGGTLWDSFKDSVKDAWDTMTGRR